LVQWSGGNKYMINSYQIFISLTFRIEIKCSEHRSYLRERAVLPGALLVPQIEILDRVLHKTSNKHNITTKKL